MKRQRIVQMLLLGVLIAGQSFAGQSLTLVLIGNESDSHFIKITRNFSVLEKDIVFEICTKNSDCRPIGQSLKYNRCQINEMVRTPLWAVILDGGSAFSKAGSSWVGFSKILVAVDDYDYIRKHLEAVNPVRVTSLMFEVPAKTVFVEHEARRMAQALIAVDRFNCR